MSVEKFTDGFVNFVNRNFNPEQHTFLVYGRKTLNLCCIKEKNVQYRRDIGIYLSKESNIDKLLTYDKIFIHGLFDRDIINRWFLNSKLCEKTYIYLWGGDFYPEVLKEDIITNVKRRYLLKYAAGIINVLPIEQQIINKLYHVKGKQYSTVYYDARVLQYLSTDVKQNEGDSSLIKIQVGNSATESNCHKEILETLYKYKDENILIYAPLSYGDMEYANEIEAYGKKLYGNKFIAIRNFMELEKYYDFMRQMDIAIFGMTRQQALGNIEAHLAYGNVLYLKKKSVEAYYLRKNLKCHFRCIEDVPKLTFEEFKKLSVALRKDNARKILHKAQENTVITEWELIFNDH
jgi:hypothetical protein